MKSMFMLTVLCLWAPALVQSVADIKVTVSKSVVDPGDNVTITCVVSDLEDEVDPAAQIVIMYKSVIGDLIATPTNEAHEAISINDIIQPLYQKGRYQATKTTSGQSAVITLKVQNVTEEESGHYGCMLAGDVLFNTAALEVIELPESVAFTNLTGNLTITEGQRRAVQCRVAHALPAPHVMMYIGHDASGWTDITKSFIHTSVVNKNCPPTGGNDGDKLCFLNMDVNVNLTSTTFEADFQYDYQYLKCSAHVPGTDDDEVVSTQIMLDLSYSPKFRCPAEVKGRANDSLEVTCPVWFNPQLMSANWTFEINGKAVSLMSGDDPIEGVTASQFRLEEGFGQERETQFKLKINRLSSGHFTKYTLTAKNELGTNSFDIQVKEDKDDPSSGAATTVLCLLTTIMSLSLALYSA